MNPRDREQLSTLELFKTTNLFGARKQGHLQAIFNNYRLFFIITNSVYMPDLLNNMFEAFEKMLVTDNPLLNQSHPYFHRMLIFFIIYNACKQRLQLNLDPITIPNYQGNNWVTNLIKDHTDHVINLDPDVGNKTKNNLAILESLKIRDPSVSFELLMTQPQRSALVAVLTLFNSPLDQLRVNISLLNMRERSLARYLMVGDLQFITLLTEVESEERRQLHYRLRNNWLVITGPLIESNEASHLISSDNETSESETSDSESTNTDSDQGWAPPAVIRRLSDLHQNFNNV